MRLKLARVVPAVEGGLTAAAAAAKTAAEAMEEERLTRRLLEGS